MEVQTVVPQARAAHEILGVDQPESGRIRHLRIWFYVGVPLLLAFALAWMRIGRAAEWPVAVGLLYWLGYQVIAALLGTLFTAPVARAFRPRNLPLWLVLALGQVFASIAVIPAVQIWQCAVNDMLPMGAVMPTITLSLDSLAQIVPVTVCYWVLLNLFFVDFLRFPRFGYGTTRPETDATESDASAYQADDDVGGKFAEVEAKAEESPTAAEDSATPAPEFFERIRPERRGNLLALRAEGHYLRVYTDKGEELITYRLSDALAEIPSGDGMQVHRSWWVADRSLTAQRHSESLKLINGLEIPVSRSNLTAARQRGWLNGR